MLLCLFCVLFIISNFKMENLPSTSQPKDPIVSLKNENDNYRILEGGFKIPTLGLGTVFHADEDADKAIDTALSLGYRHIDTAFMYQTEKAVGEVLHKWITSGKLSREEVFITSKLPFQGTHAEAVEPFIKESLKSLQLEYLDLYLIHFPVAFKYEGIDKYSPIAVETDHVAVWKKMEEQVEAGRTKYIGLSNFNIRQIERIMKIAKIKPVCLQIEMHVLIQQRELVKYCHENNIIIVAYAPLGSPQFHRFQGQMEEKVDIPNLLGNEVVKKVAEKHKKTTAQILIRFIIEKGACAIPKSTKLEHMKDNLEALNFKLDCNDMAALALLDEGDKGKIIDLAAFFPQLRSHPEYPY